MSRELVLLGDFRFSGTLSANTLWTPSPRDGGAELDTDEMAEIAFAEVRSPLNADGTPQDIGALTFVLDDQDIGQYVRIPMRDDWNIFPPRRHVWESGEWSTIIYFGKPIFEAVNSALGLLEATTLKYREDVRPIVRAAGSNVTAPFRVRLWGYRYTDARLKRLLGDRTTLSGTVEIADRIRQRTFRVSKPDLAVGRDTWLLLPGGPKQEKPIVMPYIRFARNANPTQLNLPYEFRFDVGITGTPNVASFDEELYWRYDTEKKALWLQRVGVRGHANGGYFWLEMTGDPEQKEHPKKRIPFNDRNNDYHFGRSYPVWGDVTLPPVYYPLRRFADHHALIAGEKAFVAFVDNGVAVVPANGVVFCVQGVLIEMREDQAAPQAA